MKIPTNEKTFGPGGPGGGPGGPGGRRGMGGPGFGGGPGFPPPPPPRRRFGFGYGPGYGYRRGCYVATCVYGSYDCPQVWVLRRFRDNYLAKRVLGRAFIKTYYTFSPWIVEKFGHYSFFKKFFKKRLDHMVVSLEEKGYEHTPYDDPAY